MRIIRGLHNLQTFAGSVVTIGNFDGVHAGHQQILSRLVQEAQDRKVPATVICFEPQPREFFSKLSACPTRISTLRAKLEQFKQLGIDNVLILRFDQRLQALSAEQFVQQILIEQLHVKWLVVGDDFRFGNDRKGDFNYLKKAGEQSHFDVVETSTISNNNDRISSTLIRRLLAESNLFRVEKLLNRAYSIQGKVVYGQQLGRTIGVPTANICLNMKKPAIEGVYAVEVCATIKDKQRHWFGVANAGAKPTVNQQKPQLEVHLFDCNEQLYSERLTVTFRHKIREVKKFSGLDALKTQIKQDIQIANDYFRLSDQND